MWSEHDTQLSGLNLGRLFWLPTTCLVKSYSTKSELYPLVLRDISMNDLITIRWSNLWLGYSLESTHIDMALLGHQNMCFGLKYDN